MRCIASHRLRTIGLSVTAILAMASTTACPGDKTISNDDTANQNPNGGGDDTSIGDDSGQVSNEAGDSIDQAESLTDPSEWTWGSPIASDAIDPAGDRDFFKFDATSGEVYYLAVAADMGAEAGQPDSVMRLYDQDGNLIATNDDMPLRIWGTDSGIEFQAAYDGPYYIEVLEWSDWDTGSDGPEGGSDYTYDLWGSTFTNLFGEAYPGDTEPNDTPAEADALVANNTNEGYYTNPFVEAVGDSAPIDFSGDMYQANDIDYWAQSFTSDVWAFWSLWPSARGSADFRFKLYDQDGNLVASSDSPTYSPDGHIFYDFGILYPAKADDTYYLEVFDANGTSGDGTFYPGFIAAYNSDVIDSESATYNDAIGAGDSIVFTESSNFPGLYAGYTSGTLDGTDVADNYRAESSDAGGFDSRYLSVYIQAAQVGSLLDAKVTVYDQDGNVLESATDQPDDASAADPEIWDLDLSGVDSVNIMVEPESQGDATGSNYYIMGVVVYDSPIN